MKEKTLRWIKGLYEENTCLIPNSLIEIYNRYNRNKITFRHYNRQYKVIKKPLISELNKFLNFCTDFELEFYVRKFEKKIAKFYGTKFAIGTHSGTAALQLSLIALGIGEDDEVITTSNSYTATALAISNVGAKPVFVDVNETTYNIDVDKIESAITDKTKAIIPVHLYGQMCDMTTIKKIAKKHKLKIIEDACQAFGAEYGGKKAGSLGHAGCFSFFISKNIGSWGNGGMIILNNKKLVKQIKLLRDPESNDKRLILSKRTPCYLDAIQAVFLNVKLKYIDEWIRLKREKAKLYTELLGTSDVLLPSEEKNAKHAYYSYVIRSKQRNKLRKFLSKNHIETRIEYIPPIHLTKTFYDLKYKEGDFPITEKLSKEILSLPITPFITDEEIEKITKYILKF